MKLVPVVLLVLGLAGGYGAGVIFAPPDAPCGDGSEADAGAADCPEPDAADELPEDEEGAAEFVRMNDQFVVPVMANGQLRSLVVLSLTLEVGPGAASGVFGIEPKLRDAMLRVLFDHANSGGFDGAYTAGLKVEGLRRALLEAAQKTAGPVVRDVLILDLLRQDA